MAECNEDKRSHFILCDKVLCFSNFKYVEWVIHSKVDGPDPRDHLANERNFLSWLRTSMTLILIGFMTLIDLRFHNFAPSYSLPWADDDVSTKTKVVAYIFVALGLCSISTAVVIYFVNQRKILHRLYHVGHGWAGYMMALLITFFVCFVMAIAISEM